MLKNSLFSVGLIAATIIGILYFRDLGDLTQMVMKVKRQDMNRFIRNEYKFLTFGLVAIVIMTVGHFTLGTTPQWLYWGALVILGILYIYPWMWIHVLLRNQQNSAKYFRLDQARTLIAPTSSVVVIEKDGVARAHPDNQIRRPHLAGNEDGLNGENVVMTYCAMANLGVGYIPEIEGKKIDLEVMAQHGNNLILRDTTTGEPIQHIYGYREKDGKGGPAMKPWPTFRMSFRGFQKAYPDGQVFLNKPSGNPLLRLLDTVTDAIFSIGIAQQHNEEKPLMENMSHYDDRLPNKTYVWGINIGDDAVCYTDDFIIENARPINATIGDRQIVVSYDPKYESVGAWYNDSGNPIKQIDFFGNSDQGKLKRIETLKSGMFWHVWVEFFQQTDINRSNLLVASN